MTTDGADDAEHEQRGDQNAQGDHRRRLPLRFDVPAAPAGSRLVGARLAVRTTGDSFAGSAAAHAVTTAGGGWTETGLTWNNRVPLGAELGAFPAGSTPNATVGADLDVAALAASGSGVLDLGVTSTSSDNLWFLTRMPSPKIIAESFAVISARASNKDAA